MSNPKILFSGCSFTANSGFNDTNILQYHWPHLVGRKFNANLTNIAIGGSSNDEIFYRVAVESVNQWDLAVVMWSDIGRRWEYCSSQNVDNFTICNNGITAGFNCDYSDVKQYAKLHYTYFDNHYVKLKNWLLQTITLAATLTQENIPYVFLRGFSNYIELFNKIQYQTDQGFTGIVDTTKALLDFDRRPDWYIREKVLFIQNLINRTRTLNWINIDTPAFADATVDYADDQKHPGIVSNQNIANQIIDYCHLHQIFR